MEYYVKYVLWMLFFRCQEFSTKLSGKCSVLLVVLEGSSVNVCGSHRTVICYILNIVVFYMKNIA